jgi:hypothetical protein
MSLIDANPDRDRDRARHMDRDSVRIVVDIEPGEPVSGAAGRVGDPPVRFEGMLGFVALFQRLRQDGRDAPASLPDREEGPVIGGGR